MPAVVDNSSAVCNNSDEFVQIGESLCDVFWRLSKCNMCISDFQIFCGSVDLCCRPAGWLLYKPLWSLPHGVDVDRVAGLTPLEMRSAGLD